jgi:hypothetical protein
VLSRTNPPAARKLAADARGEAVVSGVESEIAEFIVELPLPA